MLHQLVESKNDTSGNRKLGGILLATSVTVFSALIFALIFSLFSYSLALGSENLDITALVSPVSPPDEAPPEPAKQQQTPEKTINNLPSRQTNTLRIEESPKIIPKTVSVIQNLQQSRPASPFKINLSQSEGIPSDSGTTGRGDNNQTSENSFTVKPVPVEIKEVKNEIPQPPPIIKQSPKPETKTVKTISGGVVNGQATYLAKPVYSAAARAIHASGQVKVQVTIDEDGNVTAANVISGHPLLQAAALSAAKSSKFTSTTLTNQKVKVSGVIVYNFNER